ncbi:MAG: hypothetical protein U0270_03665 [Labilithrix sp.]
MRLIHLLAVSVIAGSGFAAACGVTKVDPSAEAGDDDDGGTSSETDASSGDDDDGDGINATGIGAGTGAATGLPCDVQQLLENFCIGCHLATTTYPLLTYDDLQKPAPSDNTKTMAVKSLERLSNGTMPPKPAEAPTADEIATFKAWVDAKTPKGEVCTTPPGAADAGVPNTPYNTPTVCTSKVMWTRGDDESSSMHPGGACITCHSMKGGPAYKIAGTVYPTAHEPIDCNGVKTPVSVVVTDAKGKVTTIRTNGAGNFYSRARITPPFKVKVVDGTKERAMAGTLTAGDCNTCHTEKGVNGAPGRIMAP